MKLTICESTNSMTIPEFMTSVENIYHKYFPNSECAVKFGKNLGSTIWIDCFLAGDKTELPHGYWENDMFAIALHIFLPDGTGENDELPESITMEARSNFIKVKPTNKFLAFDGRKISFRKVTGDGKKVLASFDKFAKRLYDAVNEEYENDNIDSKYKAGSKLR